MEVFKIWTTLNLKGNAISEMKKFAALTDKASKNIEKLMKALSGVNTEFTGLHSILSKENSELRSYGETLTSVTRKTNSLAASTKKLQATYAAEAAATGVAKGGRLGMPFLGGAGTYATIGAGATLVHSFKTQEAYQASLFQLKALGYNQSQLNQADVLARTPIRGVSPTEMIDAVVAAQMATRAGPGQFNEVKMMAPELAKTAMAMKVTYHKDMTSKQIQDLIRIAEIQGGSDPNKQLMWLRAATSMMISSGGTIDPAKQLQIMRLTSGSMNWSPQGYLAMEPVIQELGSRAGTGITTGARALGNNMTFTGFSKKNLQFWEQMGLLKPSYDKAGRPLGATMPQEWLRIFHSDPSAFVTGVLLPLLAKHGITSMEGIHGALQNLPRTYAMEAWTTVKNMGKIERARALSGQILSGEALTEGVEQTPEFAVKELSSAWERFSLAIGRLTAPVAIKGMESLAGILDKLTTFFDFVAKIDSAGAGFVKKIENFESRITHPFSSIGEPTKGNQAVQVQGNVYLKNSIVGHIMGGMDDALSGHGGVSNSGPYNASFSLPSPAFSNYGSQQ